MLTVTYKILMLRVVMLHVIKLGIVALKIWKKYIPVANPIKIFLRVKFTGEI
jgi:hypothetical protein